MTTNWSLMTRVVAQILTDPEHWDQTVYAGKNVNGCGTAYCVAGWAATLSGLPQDMSGSGVDVTARLPLGQKAIQTLTNLGLGHLTTYNSYDDDELVQRGSIGYGELGRHLLGLDYWVADELFAVHNDIHDVLTLVRERAARENFNFDKALVDELASRVNQED